MAKRTQDSLVVIEESELGRQEDVWLENVFPRLYQEENVTSMWMRLCQVSKFWLRMIGKLKEHKFTVGCATQIPILVKRFSKGTEKMEASTRFCDFLGMFDRLRSLRLNLNIRSKQICIQMLVELTELIVERGVIVVGIESLLKLEKLSLLYMDNDTSEFILLQDHQNIKRLHLSKPFYNAHKVQLDQMIPKKSQLEYLESNDTYLYKSISYTGLGKCQDRNCIYNACYEGAWVEGRRHGAGTFFHRSSLFTGKWENDFLKSGKVSYFDGFYYEGEFCEIHVRDEDDKYRIQPHGNGKSVDRNTVYKGEFSHGSKHGKGELYEKDVLIYSGEWVDDFPVSK